MRQWLFNSAAAVSAVLFIATAVLWAWSYWQFVDFGRIHTSRSPGAYTQHLIRLGSIDGRLLFTRRDLDWPSVSAGWESENGLYWRRGRKFDINRPLPKLPNEQSWEIRLAGCRYNRVLQTPTGRVPRGVRGMVLVVPHAYVCAVLAVLPAITINRWRLARRARRRGLCRHCAYDLTGNTSGVCPECGHEIVRAA